MRRSLKDRFWPKVAKHGPDECWLWTGYVAKNGYGNINSGGKNGTALLAHRVAYELIVGPIPEGLTLDHVRARGCRHRHCVNPAHLEPVTQAENNRRGEGIGAQNARKTHCVHGHLLEGANLVPSRLLVGERRCRACAAAYTRKRRAGELEIRPEAVAA